MLDHASRTAPDLRGIMESFKINWNNVEGGKRWFMSMIEPAVRVMYDKGEILEEWYDTHKFNLDEDANGLLYILTSSADHLCRSKVMYHNAVLSQKIKAIEVGFEIMVKDREKQLVSGRDIISNNTACENKIKKALKLPIEENLTTTLCTDVTLTILEDCTIPLLAAFYLMRTQLNVMDKVILPRKGSDVDVVSGLKDRKGGELLLSLAYNARFKEKIGTLPDLPTITRPVQIVEPPNVVRIQPFYHDNAIEDSVDEDWCNKARQVLSF